ncbi:acyl-CoA dehydrogenase family protein [Polymorphospora rubra]|uniref:Acyl-CoA dehydrogenase n=1 Tax=Polymorphospora rubra TaxID=338584 RepID=A0A810NAD1_9ACTN|nr:acyl-CoA dehydrogenase family protein [Polymorphospora rubra]BCJ68778.1 acyl-CoA dehydrogenase [Polymorphospora rubra]
MNFDLTPEQEELRARIRAFAAAHVAPDYQAADTRGAPRPGLYADLAGAGLLGLRVATGYGGLGRDAVSTGVALEELARADFNACYPALNAALIADVLAANGDRAQRDRWLPPIADGSAIVALCLTEPAHGTDAAAIEMRAEPDGDKGWRLYGVKSSIMLGGYATHGLVFARTGAAGPHGITACYVRLDDTYVTRRTTTDVGNRSAGRAELTFDGLPVGVDDVVAGPGLGFVQVMRGFDYSRALISLICIGAASASLSEAFDHARERHAFGQPIGRFQGLSFPLVEHATYLHAARLLAYEALWRKDAGQDHRLAANMAKWWAPRAAFEAAHQALLTFGQHGWSDERPLGQRMRDVMGLEIGDGTAQVTKLVVARLLLGRDSAP